MITLYRPGRSPLHRVHAAAKLAALVVLAASVSFFSTVLAGLAALGVVLLGCIVARLGARFLAQQVWAARWPVLMIGVSLWFFVAPADAVVGALRILALLLAAALVTATTPMGDVLGVVTRVAGPLRRFGVDPRRVALVLQLTITLIPVIASFAHRIRDAQTSRGVRPGVRFVLPLLVMSLRHADGVADALTARGVD
ncbi:energy-coupling factor transporter transmembrane component T family protein [Microbacterium gorillae]|uniref:energy-coupling factor transporter transmembrane component T family protein n=1 Tax=Microbacterium gorillae TaxID=1231063 RepID=UPI00058C3FCC|nr:energy-coupling factor transporter transmembrane protein EcfT [Microbacterium gorillae]